MSDGSTAVYLFPHPPTHLPPFLSPLLSSPPPFPFPTPAALSPASSYSVVSTTTATATATAAAAAAATTTAVPCRHRYRHHLLFPASCLLASCPLPGAPRPALSTGHWRPLHPLPRYCCCCCCCCLCCWCCWCCSLPVVRLPGCTLLARSTPGVSIGLLCFSRSCPPFFPKARTPPLLLPNRERVTAARETVMLHFCIFPSLVIASERFRKFSRVSFSLALEIVLDRTKLSVLYSK